MSSKPKKNRTKQYLMLLTVAGLIAIVGGSSSGTFASFSAETTNAGNYFATGTLLLHNVGVDSQGAPTTLCKSETNSNNANAGCDALFSVPASNGSDAAWAKLTLTNAGSIDAQHVTVDDGGTLCAVATPASITQTTLKTALVVSPATTALVVTTLSANLAKGDSLVVSEGGHAQTFTVSAPATAGTNVSVAVNSATAVYAFSTAATVDTSPVFGIAPTDCSGMDFMIVETNAAFAALTTSTGESGGVSCALGFGSPGTDCSFDTTENLNLLTSTAQNLNDPSGTAVGLTAGQSRYYWIGVKPDSAGSNEFQNRRFNFKLHWKLTQV